MSPNPKLSGALGLAIRAGKCTQGTQQVELAVKKGRALLVVLDPAASENLAKAARDMCAFYRVPLLVLPVAGMLEEITGRENRRILAVTDAGFAKMIQQAATPPSIQ